MLLIQGNLANKVIETYLGQAIGYQKMDLAKKNDDGDLGNETEGADPTLVVEVNTDYQEPAHSLSSIYIEKLR